MSENDLSRELPRDAELSALYRAAAEALPPPALDRSILAAAQAAVKPVTPAVRRSRPWWLRFAAPMGVFATLILTVTVVMLVEREQQDLLPRGAQGDDAPAAASAPVQNVEPEQKKEKAAAEPMPQRLQAPAATSAAAPEAAAPAVAGSVAPPPAERRSAAGAAADAAMSRDEAKASAPALAAPAPSAQPAASSGELSSRPAAAPPAPLLERAAPMSKSMERAARGSVNSSADQAQRSPEAWLAEIRRLRTEGREAEAREQLERFRQTYPDFVMPADLR